MRARSMPRTMDARRSAFALQCIAQRQRVARKTDARAPCAKLSKIASSYALYPITRCPRAECRGLHHNAQQRRCFAPANVEAQRQKVTGAKDRMPRCDAPCVRDRTLPDLRSCYVVACAFSRDRGSSTRAHAPRSAASQRAMVPRMRSQSQNRSCRGESRCRSQTFSRYRPFLMFMLRAITC